MPYVSSSRGSSRAWEAPTHVVPIADWSKTPANAGIYSHYEAPSPPRTPHRSKTTSSRKPLRSSPLAGPALSNHSEAFIELEDTPNDDTHISTSEHSSEAARGRNVHDGDHDGESFPAPAPPRSAHLRVRSSQGPARTSSAEATGYPSASRASSSTLRHYHSYHASTPTSTSAMHNIAGNGHAKRRRPLLDAPTDSMTNNLLRPPSAMHPPTDKAHTRHPDRVARSSDGAKRSKDITGLGSAQDARGARYSSAPFSSSSSSSSNLSASTWRRRVSTVLEVDGEDHDTDTPANLAPDVGTGVSAHPHPNAKRTRPAPTDNSWYTANAYDVTPKFTRLGLAGPGVVLPVSARAHRKQQQQQSNPSASNVDKEKEKRASIASFQLTRRSSTVSSLASTSTSTSTRDGIGSAWLEAPSPSTHSSSSSPSPTPTCSSPASSVSSLPLTIMTPKSAASSQATSLVGSSRTSIEEIEPGTAKLDNNSTSHQDSRIFALKKRQSVSLLSRMASWRRSTPTVDEFAWSEQHEADWALIEKAQPISLDPLESEKGNLPHASVNVAVTVEVHLDPVPSDECSASAESETESRESVFERGDSGRYVDPRVTKLALRREKNVGVSTVKRCGSVRRFWEALVGAGPGSLNHHPGGHGEVMRE